MFRDHQEQIADYAWRNPQGIIDTLTFVRITVRRHLYDVQAIVDDVRANGILALPMQQDRKAYESICAIAPSIYRSSTSNTELFFRILSIPGFGMVKAGFAVQLLYGDIGCMDTHNVRKFGLNSSMFRTDGSWVSVYKRCHLYIALCKSLGGAEYLWDSWCVTVAAMYPHIYENAEHVSRLHVEGIVR